MTSDPDSTNAATKSDDDALPEDSSNLAAKCCEQLPDDYEYDSDDFRAPTSAPRATPSATTFNDIIEYMRGSGCETLEGSRMFARQCLAEGVPAPLKTDGVFRKWLEIALAWEEEEYTDPDAAIEDFARSLWDRMF